MRRAGLADVLLAIIFVRLARQCAIELGADPQPEDLETRLTDARNWAAEAGTSLAVALGYARRLKDPRLEEIVELYGLLSELIDRLEGLGIE